jgi:hypothetical protein
MHQRYLQQRERQQAHSANRRRLSPKRHVQDRSTGTAVAVESPDACVDKVSSLGSVCHDRCTSTPASLPVPANDPGPRADTGIKEDDGCVSIRGYGWCTETSTPFR